MKRILSSILILAMVINLTACSTKYSKYDASFIVLFNTITEVMGYAKSKEDFQKFSQFIYNNLEEYHQLYDKYKDYDGINNIKTINDNAGIAPVKVDKRIIDMLLFSREMYDFTNETVNIALGAVLEIWHDYREYGIENPLESSLPPMEQLKDANMYTDINKVIINIEDSTVFLEEKEMSLDVGSIAKGYATEKVAQLAKDAGYNNFLLSVGGNIRAMGGKEDGVQSWNVGIRNPDKYSENKTIYTVSAKDVSLVSSGDYERYYTVNNKQYHHIIDPKTLMPSEYFTAVSILCEDSGIADALSTAIFNLPFEDGLALIESMNDTEALWILKDGTSKFSSGFEAMIIKN